MRTKQVVEALDGLDLADLAEVGAGVLARLAAATVQAPAAGDQRLGGLLNGVSSTTAATPCRVRETGRPTIKQRLAVIARDRVCILTRNPATRRGPHPASGQSPSPPLGGAGTPTPAESGSAGPAESKTGAGGSPDPRGRREPWGSRRP